ncbi:MAG: Hydroxyacylglutathione hydrolase [Bacteroidota bacterium]
MKKTILSLLFLGTMAMSSCSQSGEGIANLNPKEFQESLIKDDNVFILDVRTPEEFAGGHLEGATNININSSNFDSEIENIDKERNVYVYCLSGGRSTQAANALKEKGFKHVINMNGGILAWSNSGLPVTLGAPRSAGSSDELTNLTEAQFQELLAGKGDVIVDFNAVWCGPCKVLGPILDEYVEEQGGKVTLIKIDVDKNMELAQAKNIQAIPFVERYNDGKLTWSKIGLFSKEEL